MNYLIGFVLTFLIFLFFISSKKAKTNVPNDFGKTILSWYSPNQLWFSTKFILVGFSAVFLVPSFMKIDERVDFKLHQGLNYYWDYVNNLRGKIIPLSEIGFTNLLVILVYMVFFIFLVNIKLTCKVTDKGIYYTVFGSVKLGVFYAWNEIVCYDIDEKRNALSIWITPPIFKPDWTIHVPHRELEKINNVLKDYAVLYSVRKNAERKSSNYISTMK